MIMELYKAPRRKIEARIRRKRQGKRNVSIGAFKHMGERIYPE
ncbi:MAG TPA: hypothetical protein VJ300_01130 [Thermoplasmata archaeon]|nr:hypothetical protein [Thermoplasmata archaeon]